MIRCVPTCFPFFQPRAHYSANIWPDLLCPIRLGKKTAPAPSPLTYTEGRAREIGFRYPKTTARKSAPTILEILSFRAAVCVTVYSAITFCNEESWERTWRKAEVLVCVYGMYVRGKAPKYKSFFAPPPLSIFD